MMKAIAFTSLLVDDLRDGFANLKSEPLEFDSCCHVAATSSIARELRWLGLPTIQISHLISMMLYGTGLDEAGNPKSPDTAVYPSLGDFHEIRQIADRQARTLAFQSFESKISNWENQVLGQNIAGSIFIMTELRRILNDDANITPNMKRALLAGRRDFAKALEILTQAGIEPGHLRPTEPIGEAAQRAWASIESRKGFFGDLRRKLWIEIDEYAKGDSETAKEVMESLRSALRHVFGTHDCGPILQHGFRFFTSPQWAMFQLIENTPNTDQYFIVHDDGKSDVFQTWRHYFSESWGFNVVQYVNNSRPGSDNHGAGALRDALSGKKVYAGTGVGLRLQKLQTCVSFVNECFPNRHRVPGSDGAPGDNGIEVDRPTLFAPNAEVLARLAARFVAPSQLGPVAFSTLPVGVFLIRLHECITETPGGTTEIRFDSSTLLDVVSSGWLPISKGFDPMHLASCMRRAMPFFNGCRTGDEWLHRARSLRDLVVTTVSPYGPRDTSLTDRKRIRHAATNILRLIPWVDMTPQEADATFKAIEEANGLVTQLLEQERHKLRDFTGQLRTLVRQRLDLVPAEQRAQFEQRITGLQQVTDFDVYAEDLAEIVALLVSPPIAINAEQEDDGPVRGVSSVDRFAYRRSEDNLHLTNLSNQSFPRQNPQLSWPFREEDIQVENSHRLAASADLISLRGDVSPLSDLYLLWVLLNGVDEQRGKIVTLSYIAEFEREELEPSPVLVLLAEATKGMRRDDFRSAVANTTGGFPYLGGGDAAPSKLHRFPAVLPTQSTEATRVAALAKLENEATSSTLVCDRRLALQWLAGPTASLSRDHLHSMLYGNLPGALRERLGLPVAKGEVLCKELFRNLTTGQQESSIAKRRILWEANTSGDLKDKKSASAHWLFTLGMSATTDEDELAKNHDIVQKFRSSTDEPRGSDAQAIAKWRASMAYLAAQGNHVELAAAHAAASRAMSSPLPIPEDGFVGVTHRQCNNCPVAERCAARRVEV
jgi:hypothetical protein